MNNSNTHIPSHPQSPSSMPISKLPFSEAMRLQPPSPLWPVPGLLREGLTVLAAPPKSGASTFALDLAFSLCLGSSPAFGIFDLQPHGVLYLNFSDGHARFCERSSSILNHRPSPANLIVTLD